MEYEPTILGEKGSIKQYRHGNLHIREYDNYYSVHYDKIDPRNDPLDIFWLMLQNIFQVL